MTNKPRKRAAGAGRKPKGPINGNSGWLQARITEDLRARLEQAAAENGRSLSQEAQVRLRESFDLPSKLQDSWGPPEVRALAQFVSRAARSAQNSVVGPFTEAGDLAWHRSPYTHAAIEAAVAVILARFKPAGPLEIPQNVKEREAYAGPEQTTAESLGRAIAMGLLMQYDAHQRAPEKFSPGAHYGEAHYVFPQLRKELGETR